MGQFYSHLIGESCLKAKDLCRHNIPMLCPANMHLSSQESKTGDRRYNSGMKYYTSEK